ncbi:LOW QUALITY PROTEIN: hypothetical protein HZS_1876, partial [Henneguya salminicola]
VYSYLLQKNEAVDNVKPTRDAAEIRSFCRLMNCYRPFIHNLSAILVSCYESLEKYTKFEGVPNMKNVLNRKKFTTYLEGQIFKITTNHKPLETTFNRRKKVPDLIFYRKGEDNQNTDAFSRLTSYVEKLQLTPVWGLICHITSVVYHVPLGKIQQETLNDLTLTQMELHKTE